MEIDWGDGDYSRTARVLEPVSAEVVELVGVASGDRVLDVACGTGNAALAAARKGARVTGVDASSRLLETARERAAAEGLDAEFAEGRAERLPVADGAADVVVSVFGVIFSDDPPRAAAEMLRVARAGGQVALTAWTPEGPIWEIGGMIGEALRPPGAEPPPRPWSQADTVAALLRGAGARGVAVERRQLPIAGPSPEGWLDDEERHHPVWRAARRAVGDEGWPALRARMLAALERGNEDPGAFVTTSGYLVVRATA